MLPERQAVVREQLRTLGFEAAFAPARKTEKGWVSAGGAVVWSGALRASAPPRVVIPHRAVCQEFRLPHIGAVSVMAWYGKVDAALEEHTAIGESCLSIASRTRRISS